MAERADVVVIGLGAVGSATLYRLALAGSEVMGIDRYKPPHDLGSSHGESRITRLAVGEGADYAPLVRRSHEIWRELEIASGESLLLQTGGLIMGPSAGAAKHHGKGDFVRRTIQVAHDARVPVEVLDAPEITFRYPQFMLRGDELGCFEPTAGMVFPERCVSVQLRLARQAGARIHTDERVTGLRTITDGVEVTTNRRTVHAARAVLAAGPWVPGITGGKVASVTKVYRQTLHWFPVEEPSAFAPGRCPVFIWMHGEHEEDYFYGFPALPGSTAIKVASERYAEAVDPDSANRAVERGESDAMFTRHVSGRLRGIEGSAARAVACLYTVTPDAGFILDLVPEHAHVIVASACSGHGFKHSAALGEYLADHVLGRSAGQSSAFQLSRLESMQ